MIGASAGILEALVVIGIMAAVGVVVGILGTMILLVASLAALLVGLSVQFSDQTRSRLLSFTSRSLPKHQSSRQSGRRNG